MTTTEWRELSRRLNTAPGWGLLALRLFLGITFAYAGLQKLSDPAFFGGVDRPGSLAMQLDGYQHASPLGPLLGLAGHMTTVVGLSVIVAELAVGFGMVLGLWTRWAALGGMTLSLVLWLSVSWQVSPYFLGPDTIYLVAFTPFLMLGATDPLALDVRVRAQQRRAAGIPTIATVAVDFATVQHVCGRFDRGRCTARGGRRCTIDDCPVLRGPVVKAPVEAEVTRREVLQKAGVAAGALGAAVVLGGVARAVGRHGAASAAEPEAEAGSAAGGGASTGAVTGGAAAAEPVATTVPAGAAVATVPAGTLPQPTPPVASAVPASAGTPVTVRPSGTTPRTAARPAAAPRPSGTPVAAAADVPVGGTLAFVNPHTGVAAYLSQPAAGTFRAFDASCTHAGCRVRSPGGGQFACPCHGARFDTATGAVLRGPAKLPLARVKVTLGADGQLYV